MQSDPEVAADIALRNRTERERRPMAAPERCGSPEIVGQWPCRNPVCRQPTQLTSAGANAWEVHNKILAKMGEPPLSTAEVLICDSCVVKLQAQHSRKNRQYVEEMRAQIAELKQAPDGTGRWNDAIAELKKLHHPDLDGLVAAIRERKALDKSTARKGTRL